MQSANKVGVATSSFNSVSINSALVLWSIDKNAYSAPVYKTAEHFIVNVLRNDQVETSNQFARGNQWRRLLNY